MLGFERLDDQIADDLRQRVLAQLPLALVELRHEIGIGALTGVTFCLTSGDAAPLGLDAAGLDDDHIDAEVRNLVAERVRIALQRIFGGVAPTT